MHSVSRDIDAPAGIAWRLLSDTNEWSRWGPSVRAVDTRERLLGPGSRGRVQTSVGLWLPFEITEWVPGVAWAWRVAGIEATCHLVEPLGPERCRVSFPIPRWAPLYRPACTAALQRIAERANAANGD